MKKIIFLMSVLFVSTLSLSQADPIIRNDLDRAIRIVESSDYVFDRSGEYAAQNELRDADYILIRYDRDYNIRNARYDIASAVRMLNDRYASRRDKQYQLRNYIRQINRSIQNSDLYRRPLPPPPGRSFIVRCESLRDLPMRCDLGRSPAYRVILTRQHSSASCVEGRTWGVDFARNNIWVTRGCRASFQVFVR